MKKIELPLFLSLSILAGFGCSEDGVVEKVENRWDCNDICKRFAECYAGDDYDTDNCVKECTDNAEDEDFERRVDKCENCLDDEDSCVKDTADCADECAGVVLQSS